jgi:hypothetical protein
MHSGRLTSLSEWYKCKFIAPAHHDATTPSSLFASAGASFTASLSASGIESHDLACSIHHLNSRFLP